MNQIPNIEEIEALSEKIHHLYCAQYEKDNGEPYWTKGDYSKLDERTKEYDRNIARFIHHQLQKAQRCGKELPDGSICGCRLDCHLHDWRQREEIQKAREEERKRIANLVVEHSYTNDYGDYMGDSDKILQAIHSELDQDTPKE